MAIQATITTIQGITLQQAYINFAPPHIIKERQEDGTNTYKLDANACVYSSKEYYDTKILAKETTVPVEGISVSCVLDLTLNVLEQGYEELQKNTRLSNIVEVL